MLRKFMTEEMGYYHRFHWILEYSNLHLEPLIPREFSVCSLLTLSCPNGNWFLTETKTYKIFKLGAYRI